MAAQAKSVSALAGRAPSVVVLASRLRWEEKAILDALESRATQYEVVDPRRMIAALDEPVQWRGVALGREISHTRALYTALSLENAGVRVINSARSLEICGDKWRTALALRSAGLPTPRTTLALTPEAARELVDDCEYPLVFKPLVGSWGRRVALIRDSDAADAVLEYCSALPAPQSHLVCVQEVVGTLGQDIRVIVVGGEVLGAMRRFARTGWKANVALGADAQPYRLGAAAAALAVKAVRATGAEIAGVDLLERADGELCVLEVNAGVEFRGFSDATGIDVAGAIVNYVLEARR